MTAERDIQFQLTTILSVLEGLNSQAYLQRIKTTTNTTLSALGTITETVITPASWASVGVPLSVVGVPAPLSATYTQNQAVYVPFAVTSTRTAYKMFCLNGSTVDGNLDLAIYNSSGTRLVSIGATAQAGTSVTQIFNIADTSLEAGTYYMAISGSSATGTLFRWTSGSVPAEFLNVGREAAAHPLPAAATFAANTATLSVPVFGVAFRSDFT